MNFGDAKFDGAIDKKFQGQYNYLVDLLSRQLKKEFDFYKSELQKYSKVPETGTNANGNYVKYEDGTLICWNFYQASIDVTTLTDMLYRGSQYWTFPYPFIDTNYCISGTSNAINGTIGNLTGASATGTTFYVISSRSATSRDARIIAIGKWK